MTKRKALFQGIRMCMRLGIICLCSLFAVLISGCAGSAEPVTSSSKIISETTSKNENVSVETVTDAEDEENAELQVADSSDIPLLGVVEGDVYKNSYFDIAYKSGSGYEFYTEAELKAANGLTAADFFADERAIREMVTKRPNGYYDMMSLGSDGSNVNIVIVSTNQATLKEITQEALVDFFMSMMEELKKTFYSSYQANGMELKSMDAQLAEKVIFGETQKGVLLDSTINYQGLEIKQKQFMTFF